MFKVGKFVPNPLFFVEVERKKLETVQLSEDQITIYLYTKPLEKCGSYYIYCDEESFNRHRNYPRSCTPIEGTLYIMNTIENVTKKLKECKTRLQNHIISGLMNARDMNEVAAIAHQFLILCFSDPKEHTISYVTHFPIVDLLSDKNLATFEWNTFEATFKDLKKETVIKELEEFLAKSTISESTFFQIDPKRHKCDHLFNIDNIACFHDISFLRKSCNFYLLNIIAWVHYFKKMDEYCFLLLKYVDSRLNVDHVLNVTFNNLESSISWFNFSSRSKEKSELKVINLSSLLSQENLIKSTFSLNLKLMRWNLYPRLDLEKHNNLKCLLIGAGTLGCNVARNLLGWGITNITFVDNAYVSLSNPPRQSLYILNDCKSVKKLKADAAPQAMRAIYEYGNYKGVNMTIPQPGHVVHETELNQTKAIIEQLENIIIEHDVIFLLTDSKESRWLPSVISAYHRKVVICAAIGGDTFVVIRHGIKTSNESISDTNNSTIPCSMLGCYFCNDISRPDNSIAGRSYDQRCSVSRPGASMMAASHAVELLISLINHPLGVNTPSLVEFDTQDMNDSTDSSPMGIVPHQIRYFIPSYTLMMGCSKKFSRCCACSDYVLDEYGKDKINFVVNVCNDSKHLEKITGINEILVELNDELENFEF